jgi:hypothetical protein
MMKGSKIRTLLKRAVAVLTISAILAGCTGMSPYEPRNNREEGPEKGLFSGSQGEFVIFRGDPSTEVDTGELEEASPEK